MTDRSRAHILDRRTVVDGLTLLHKAYPDGLRMARHAHEDWRFCLLLTGSYTDSWRRGYRTRAAWQLSLHPEGESHTTVFHASSRCFHIELAGAWRQRLLGDAGMRPEPQEFLHGQVPQLAAQLFRTFQDFGDDAACSALIAEGLAYELIGWTGREVGREAGGAGAGPVPAWLRHARELLHDRFSNADALGLDHIAAAVGVHPVHLAREFRRRFGCTIGDYVRRLRVAFVADRLGTTATLAELAAQAGFSDQSHLCRVFKRVTGQTPRQARAKRVQFRS